MRWMGTANDETSLANVMTKECKCHMEFAGDTWLIFLKLYLINVPFMTKRCKRRFAKIRILFFYLFEKHQMKYLTCVPF